MMRGVFYRAILATAAISVATLGVASPAHADPQTASHSPSYRDGYTSEHDFYSIPKNHEFLANEMRNGYTAALACQVEIRGGSPPASPPDWISGCVDALHDLGFKP